MKDGIQDLEALCAFQQSVIDGVAEPILVIGPDYQIRWMNRAAREFSSGDTAAEPSLCYQVSHRRETPCQGVEHPCPLEQVRKSNQPVAVIHQHYQVDGETRFVEIAASPLFGKDGTFQGIVESTHDITDRQRAEEALETAYEFQQTLIDGERQRIARELHDGLAQLLGYVNTKAMAVRLLLKNRQVEAAEKHLLQLEEAARELFVDVREAIIDLKMANQGDAGLADMLRDFTTQFSQLSGLEVDLSLYPATGGCPLPAEVRLHLLRIAQEALANVRKHAQATKAQVDLSCGDGILELVISDDGRGFDPDGVRDVHWPNIGLSAMRERAEVIGATFDLRSKPGSGTCITVRLAVDDLPLARSKEN